MKSNAKPILSLKKMDELFENYKQLFNELYNLRQQNNNNLLRLFNIRFRLAKGMQVRFSHDVRPNDSDTINSLYGLMVKLNEFWNSYEVLIKYANSLEADALNRYNITRNKITAFPLAFLNAEFGQNLVLTRTAYSFRVRYNNNVYFTNSINHYFIKLNNDVNLNGTTLEFCLNFREFLNTDNNFLQYHQIIALIYAERNIYVHNGSDAVLDMYFTQRKYYLETLISTFEETLSR